MKRELALYELFFPFFTLTECDSKKCSTNPPICELGYEAIGDIPEGHCCTVYTCGKLRVQVML